MPVCAGPEGKEADMTSLREFATPLAAVAAILLVLLVNPWLPLEGTLNQLATVAFWVVSILLLLALFTDRRDPQAEEVEIEGPAFARFLFNNSRAGLFWLPIRLFVGFEWLESGLGKLGNPAWTQGGKALQGYWETAISVPEQGRPPITYEWYRSFLEVLLANNAQSWFSWVIVFGEIAVGVGLLLGALTGIAAFFGAFMNMSFMLAGSASTNPIMFTLAVGLILAWKVAGYYGLDRWLLPRLGTPWRPGVAVRGERGEAPTPAG
jgi:thiosulfate dehydrogenase [quinone] large subunit